MAKSEQMEQRQVIGELSRQLGIPVSQLGQMKCGEVQPLIRHRVEQARQEQRAAAAGIILARRMLTLMAAAEVPRWMSAAEAIERGLISAEQVEAAQRITESDMDEAITAADTFHSS